MNKYIVRVKKSYESEFEVEAEDVFEAEQKGIDLFDCQTIQGHEMLMEETDCEREESN